MQWSTLHRRTTISRLFIQHVQLLAILDSQLAVNTEVSEPNILRTEEPPVQYKAILRMIFGEVFSNHCVQLDIGNQSSHRSIVQGRQNPSNEHLLLTDVR